MKLKEAQMLGILALIAVGIILLCMWGGEEETAAPAPFRGGSAPSAQASMEPTIAELYEELLYNERAEPRTAKRTPVEEATVEIGGITAPAEVRPTEEATLRRVIEERAPEEIPLTPREEPLQEPAPRTRPAPALQPRTHVVQRGETLSEISKDYYGTSTKWREILKANSGILDDPRLLRPGMKLKIPALPEVASAATRGPVLSAVAEAGAAPRRTYTVQQGDSLFRIAMKSYGDGTRWKDIQQANNHLIDDPKKLRPGMVLIIP